MNLFSKLFFIDGTKANFSPTTFWIITVSVSVWIQIDEFYREDCWAVKTKTLILVTQVFFNLRE